MIAGVTPHRAAGRVERGERTPMFQVRIHGRGGQGVVTAAEMLSIAAFAEGKHSQAFPSFGSERMGAPVVSYVRIDDAPIELTEPVMEPDLLIIQDPSQTRENHAPILEKNTAAKIAAKTAIMNRTTRGSDLTGCSSAVMLLRPAALTSTLQHSAAAAARAPYPTSISGV